MDGWTLSGDNEQLADALQALKPVPFHQANWSILDIVRRLSGLRALVSGSPAC